MLPKNFEYHGVVGMGLSNHTNGESLIENMFCDGVIEEYIATFWLNKEGLKSNITLGGIPDELRDIPSLTLQTKNNEEELIWGVELSGLNYGSKNIR